MALDLHAGDRVADVGAGRGYLTFRLAAAVGESGRVVATDIDGSALGELEKRASALHAANVEARRVKPEEPGLENNSYDLILLSEVDQYLGDRTAYLHRLIPSLKSSGRIAITNKLTYREAAIDSARAAGLCPIRETRDLPAHYLTIFEASPCKPHE